MKPIQKEPFELTGQNYLTFDRQRRFQIHIKELPR